jgi:hypothetical protein
MEAMIFAEEYSYVARLRATPWVDLLGQDMSVDERINWPDSASLSYKPLFMMELISVSMVPVILIRPGLSLRLLWLAAKDALVFSIKFFDLLFSYE